MLTQTEIPGALPALPPNIAAITAGATFTQETLDALVVQLRPLTLQMEQEAAALELSTDEAQHLATERAALLRTAVKGLEARRIELTGPLSEQIRAINAAVAQIVGPAKSADAILSRKIIDRQRQREQQERETRERAARQEAEAREQQRVRDQAVIDARHAPAVPTTREEFFALIDQLDREAREPATLEEFFNQEDARPVDVAAVLERTADEAVLDLELPAAPVIAPPRRAVMSNGKTVAVKQNWQWEVTSLAEVPEEYLKPRQLDTAKLTRVVKAGLHKIPGIRVWDAGSLEVRS